MGTTQSITSLPTIPTFGWIDTKGGFRHLSTWVLSVDHRHLIECIEGEEQPTLAVTKVVGFEPALAVPAAALADLSAALHDINAHPGPAIDDFLCATRIASRRRTA